MAINKNAEIKKVHTITDRVAQRVTKTAGSMPFLIINVTGFAFWILLNQGYFGESLIVDAFPFNFLTTTVSIEAIILSTFVLMSQRREAKLSEIRAELDYQTDLETEVDIKAAVGILKLLADKQGIDVSHLLADMKGAERKTISKSELVDLN
jgi:uncharacterized membrane protein